MGSYDHWYHPSKMIENMERSLSNLNTECVDLMYLHHCNFGKNEEFFDDALDVLTKFLESGKTKFIGLSDWSDKKIMQYIDRVSPDVVQPYRNVMDDSYEISGLKNYIDSNNVGVCFFSPIKHGLLTGKYKKPPKFKDGDYRKNVEAFNNQEIIDLLLMNKEKLSDRFSNHSQPVMHGLISPILEDAPTGCVLLGQRNEEQVVKASQLGGFISKEEFLRRVNNDEFLEWEEVYKGVFYGTLFSELENAKEKNLIFDIDVIGGLNIKRKFKAVSYTHLTLPTKA